MTKPLLFAVALFCIPDCISAQNEVKPFSNLAVGLGVGTTGIELQVATPINEHFALRAGYSFMPKISPTFNVDFNSNDAWLANDPATGNKIKSADIKGKLNMGDFKILADWYPSTTGSFHVTAGFFIGRSKLATAYNTTQVVNDEKNSEGNYKYWGTSGPELGTAMKTYTVVSDNQGNISADLKVNSFKPYIGIGVGRAIPTNRLNVSFDFGVQFWGRPSVWAYISDNDGKSYRKADRDMITNDEDYCNDIKDVLKTAEKVIVYPVLTVRLNGRIFD